MKDVVLTPTACEQVKKALQSRGKGIGIRLGVKSSGCSGFAYVMEYADQADDSEHAISYENFVVLVDQKNLSYLKGMELDYTREGLNEGFQFNNPNVEATCGCGESFSVKQ